MNLVFVHGPPAVGKLTVARELARITGFRLFHNHLTVDLLLSVFDFGTAPFVVLREQIWLSVFREAAACNVSLIFTFNPERSVRERFIQDTVETIESAGGKVFFVELTCSQQELERRLEIPSRSEFGKLGSLEKFHELEAAGAFEFRGIPKTGLTVDTTDRSAQESAQLISTHLSLGQEWPNGETLKT